jgi:hypothetical protein
VENFPQKEFVMTEIERAGKLIDALHGVPKEKAFSLILGYNIEIYRSSIRHVEELENALHRIHDKWAKFDRGYSDYDQGYSDALAACSDISDAVLVKRGMGNYRQSV